MVEKHKFKCRECGLEIYLQAWKAVCPSCDGTYTLEKVLEADTLTPKIARSGIVAGISFLSYFVMVSMFMPSATVMHTLLSLLYFVPPVIIYMLLAILALSVLARSTVGISLSMLFWIYPLIFHAINLSLRANLTDALFLTLALVGMGIGMETLILMRKRKRIMEGRFK